MFVVVVDDEWGHFWLILLIIWIDLHSMIHSRLHFRLRNVRLQVSHITMPANLRKTVTNTLWVGRVLPPLQLHRPTQHFLHFLVFMGRPRQLKGLVMLIGLRGIGLKDLHLTGPVPSTPDLRRIMLL